MTNDMAGVGKTPYGSVTRAMTSYFAWLNEQGGACGRQIELLVEDDEYSAEKALAGTKKLVAEDGVLAMLGGVGTEAHTPVGTYLNDPNGDGDKSDGIPDLFVSTGWSGWFDTVKFPWTVGFIPGFTLDGAVLGVYAKEQLAGKKVGVLFRDDDFGKEYMAGVAGALGGADKIVAESYVSEQVDVAVQVGKLKDRVWKWCWQRRRVVRHGPVGPRELGAADAVYREYEPGGRVGGGTSTAELEAGFVALDGMISTEYLLSPIEDESDDVMQEHRRLMQSYKGPQVSTLSVYGQALAETVVEALNRSCESLNRAGLMAAVESMNVLPK
jgi:ABC-type branched-subunit amino acid transport system substrate-binding protein